ncbi:MAG: serine/threonine protein kinase [Gammaproteobacteria bacterium]
MSLPATLGKFQVRRELGAGGMGVVYEGFDPAIGRRVALKVVQPSRLTQPEAAVEFLTRFRREAQAAGRLSHPNIVSVYEYGEEQPGVSFIAMEFVEGRELKDSFDKGERFPIPQVQRLMDQLLDALEYSHRHGVVHRDIKPANIIVLADGTLKVADFGIARLESSTLTQAGAAIGTPGYMSPEQFGGQTVDARSDLFSCGVVLYQLLTGERPFAGESFTTVMHKTLRENPLPPSELNVQVPHAFDSVVSKALAKRPEERFQTAAEFKAALLSVRSPQRVGARPQALDGDATVVDSRLHPERQSTAWAVLGGILVLVAAGTAYVLRDIGRETPEQERVDSVEPSPKADERPVMVAPKPLTVPVEPSPKPDPLPTVVVPEPDPVLDPGTLVIAALGRANPSDPRLEPDPATIANQLREDAKWHLIEKALALYLDERSLSQYDHLLRERLMVREGEFIQTVLDEEAPQLGGDGVMSMSLRAAVKVREIQKSLNQMSEEERIDFIRNHGDPTISVAITATRDSAPRGTPGQRSAVAENLLKERIHSFGFRIWNDGDATGDQGKVRPTADFAIDGQVAFKRLAATLPASGVTIEKVVLTSWTVKCTDQRSGEEIYYNTQIPEKMSWNSEERALEEVGRLIGEEFNKSFFLKHVYLKGDKVRLKLVGLPQPAIAPVLVRELIGVRSILTARLVAVAANEVVIEADLSGATRDLPGHVRTHILAPINRKLGGPCLSLERLSGSEVSLAFDPDCETAGQL